MSFRRSLLLVLRYSRVSNTEIPFLAYGANVHCFKKIQQREREKHFQKRVDVDEVTKYRFDTIVLYVCV